MAHDIWQISVWLTCTWLCTYITRPFDERLTRVTSFSDWERERGLPLSVHICAACWCTKWAWKYDRSFTEKSRCIITRVDTFWGICGWLVVFNVPSTVRSFRDGTPFTVPCEGCEARFLHRTNRESNLGPSCRSPLHNCCTMQAPMGICEYIPWIFSVFLKLLITSKGNVTDEKDRTYIKV